FSRDWSSDVCSSDLGWSWLARAVNLGRHNPRAVIGGIALVAALALVPSILQMGAQSVLGTNPDVLLTVVALSTLLSLVLLPPARSEERRVAKHCGTD